MPHWSSIRIDICSKIIKHLLNESPNHKFAILIIVYKLERVPRIRKAQYLVLPGPKFLTILMRFDTQILTILNFICSRVSKF